MVFKSPDPTTVARVKPLLTQLKLADDSYRNAARVRDEAMNALRRLLPDHDFSTVDCPDNPAGGHIYPPSVYHGVGNRNCVMCGQDDWSD